MKSSPVCFTLGTLAILGIGTPATAQNDIALSFDWPPKGEPEQAKELTSTGISPVVSTSVEATPAPASTLDAPLPIPPGAESPPFSGDATRPAGVYGGNEAFAVSAGQLAQSLLPPPPPPPATPRSVAPVATDPSEAVTPDPSVTQIVPAAEPHKQRFAFALNAFAKREALTSENEKSAAPPQETEVTSAIASPALDATNLVTKLFEGGADSLVAKAVGSAEGTRTPEGHKTPAYFGHKDPGNGVWNLGTFSFQHGAANPEEADAKQLARLQQQTLQLEEKAHAHGLTLSLEALLNGIDLANQAPLAALDRGGYVDWLAEAYKLNMTGTEAIVYARTRSFLDPDTQRWNAPGLGNNIHAIHHDQQRRADAIARALAANPHAIDWLGREISATLAAAPDATTSEVLSATGEAASCPDGSLFNVDLQPKSCRQNAALVAENPSPETPAASSKPLPTPEDGALIPPDAPHRLLSAQSVGAMVQAVIPWADETRDLLSTPHLETAPTPDLSEPGATASSGPEAGTNPKTVIAPDDHQPSAATPLEPAPLPTASEDSLLVPETAKVDVADMGELFQGTAPSDSAHFAAEGPPIVETATESVPELTAHEASEDSVSAGSAHPEIPVLPEETTTIASEATEPSPSREKEAAADGSETTPPPIVDLLNPMLEAFSTPRVLLPDRPRPWVQPDVGR